MRDIDPDDPAYKNLTKQEIRGLKYFSKEEKEALSMSLFRDQMRPALAGAARSTLGGPAQR